MGHIKRGNLDTAMVFIPDPKELYVMSEQMTPLLDKQIKIARQIRTLEKLRDTLLSKLMSGEVGVEYELEQQLDAPRSVVVHLDPLVTGAVPEELRPRYVEAVPREGRAALLRRKIGVCEINGENRVIAPDVGAQEHWTRIIDAQLVVRQVARVGVEQTLARPPERDDVAVGIENGKELSVLEDARKPLEITGFDWDMIRSAGRPLARATFLVCCFRDQSLYFDHSLRQHATAHVHS